MLRSSEHVLARHLDLLRKKVIDPGLHEVLIFNRDCQRVCLLKVILTTTRPCLGSMSGNYMKCFVMKCFVVVDKRIAGSPATQLECATSERITSRVEVQSSPFIHQR